MSDSIDAAAPKDWDTAFRKSGYGTKSERFGEYAGPDTAQVDAVNKPAHYQGKYECIDVIEDRLSIEAFQGYLEGNVWKYLYRYRQKNGVTDLKKAAWYLDRLIRSAV